MKTSILLSPLLISTLAVSQFSPPSILKQRYPVTDRRNGRQNPIMNNPNIALPPSDKDESISNPSGEVIISDVIGKERTINIFAGFTRDIEMISKRLDDNTQNTTVLAPLNSALQKLPRKPWEDPKDYGTLGETAYEGQDGEDRAHRNLRRFVEAHVVPVSPWKEGEKVHTLGGGNVWWESKGGKKTVSAMDPSASLNYG